MRYPKGKRDNGTILRSTKVRVIKDYMNAYFVGNWYKEDLEDRYLESLWHRYVTMYEGCPIMWKSQI